MVFWTDHSSNFFNRFQTFIVYVFSYKSNRMFKSLSVCTEGSRKPLDQYGSPLQ